MGFQGACFLPLPVLYLQAPPANPPHHHCCPALQLSDRMGPGTRCWASQGTWNSPLKGQGAQDSDTVRGKDFLISEVMKPSLQKGQEPCLQPRQPRLKSSSTVQESAKRRDSGNPHQQNSSYPCHLPSPTPPHTAPQHSSGCRVPPISHSTERTRADKPEQPASQTALSAQDALRRIICLCSSCDSGSSFLTILASPGIKKGP